MIIADPPYLLDGSGGGAFGTKRKKFRRDIDDAELGIGFEIRMLDIFKDMSKHVNQYIFCNKKLVHVLLGYAEENNLNYDILCYHKANPIPACNNKYISDTEYCIFMRESGVPVHGDYTTKKTYWVLDIKKREWDHPTIKPLLIIENLIVNSTLVNDIVVDPYMGSGTTLVAAKKLGRMAIGIEKNIDYCNIAVKRLSQSVLTF